ncbi:MAG: DoxX family protein [Bacteriovoracaceae bacterium]
MNKVKKIPFVLITIGLIVFGGMKIVGAEEMLKNMGNLNYSESFTRLLGLVEIALAIGLWFSKTRNLSTFVLFGIFSGAIGSHLGHGDSLSGSLPAAVFLIITTVAFLINSTEKNSFPNTI